MHRIYFALGFFIVGCGSNELMIRAQTIVNEFQCTHADFSRIERLLKPSNEIFNSTEESVYRLAVTLNSKMASECSAIALIKCSKGNERVIKADDIKGPINSLGVTGSTELAEHPEHDGLARTNGWRLKYRVSLTRDTLLSGLACYQSQTK